MSSSIANLAKDLHDIMTKSDRKTKPYDTRATVLKVDDSDTLWVQIPGGVDATPVRKTIDAKEGDVVQVTVSNKGAWITGNASAPPTDNTVANKANFNAEMAKKDAAVAKDAAESAVKDAGIARNAAESAVRDAALANAAAEHAVEDAAAAKESADAAVIDAAEAKEAADSAVIAASEANESADEAKQSASDAVYYANGALTSLSVVEDVVGTLSWISEHGTYTHTTDTEIDPDKIYFVLQNGVYTPVIEPKAEDLSTYYELNMDSTMQNYISSHLSLTNQGLWVVKDNQAYKILLSNTGLQVYDASGNLVSTFGENITFSSNISQTIGSEAAQISFNPTNGQITISGNVVFSNVEAIQNLQDQIDGRKTNWYYDVDPEDNTDPELIWTTTEEKERHIGDLYYNTSTGHCWRWLKTTDGGVTTYSWSQIEDSDAQEAKAIAEAATKETQLIYTQSASASSHIPLPTDWVVAFDEPTTTSTLHWTRKKPTYKTNYPVIWVATQIKSMKDDVSILNNAAYMDDTLTVIDGGHITTGEIDTDRLNVADIITTGQIATQGDIPTNLSELDDDVGYALKQDALYDEQTIYICMPAGTLTVEPYPMFPSDIQDYWVMASDEPVSGTAPDAAAGQTPHWTLKPPTYQKNFPVVFLAKQSKTILGTITCTTPVKNDTQTIIDGGHITTGTIDASKATITNIDAGIVKIGDATRTLSDVLNLVYDVTYELSADRKTVTATAHVYRGTEDVTDWFPPQCYTWFYRTEGRDNTPLNVNNVNYGYSTSVDITTIIDYEGVIVGKFIPTSVNYYIEDGKLYIDSKSVSSDDIGSFSFSFNDQGHLIYTYDNKTVADFDIHENYDDGNLHALNLSANYGNPWVKDITVFNPDSMSEKFGAIDSSAVTRTQLIYIQQPSGVMSVPKKEDAWVTNTGESVVGTPPNAVAGQTPAWTTKYPTYQSNYPVIFVARQSETLAGVISCTTPIFDDSQTIIDGGHITTGTIDSDRINTQTLAAKLVTVEGMATQEYADGVVDGYVQEDEAVSRSQRIYYRSSVDSTAPQTPGTTSTAWVSRTTVGNDVWMITKPPAIDSNDTRYKYLWTCEQRQMVDDTISYTSVVRDYSMTVIDGGYIQTGLIEADRIKVNDLINRNGILITGSNISALTNDSSYATTSDIPTDVSELNNDANYATVSDIPTDVSELNNDANYATTSQLPTKVSDLNNDANYQTDQDVQHTIGLTSVDDLSDGTDYAKKTSTLVSTVSVYYRKHSTNPQTPVTSAIITHGNTDDAWDYLMPGPTRDRTFYTCEQYTYADGNISYSAIRELAGETYVSKWVSGADSTFIDGGKLYTGSVTAEKMDANSITIGKMDSETKATVMNSKVYNIGVNNGTVGWHFLGTLTLTAQIDEADIEIHTGKGQNNNANQNLTIHVNIKRGHQPTTSKTAGITVRYEGDPTIVYTGADVCSIVVRCTEIGVMNVYMYTPTWDYADGWYQVKGRNCSWVHSGTLVTTEPSEGTLQDVSVMNPYSVATSYVTKIDGAGIFISPENQSPTEQTPGNSVKIDGTGMKIYKSGDLIATYGDSARIGKENSGNIYIDNDEIIGNGSSGRFFHFKDTSESTTENVDIVLWSNTHKSRDGVAITHRSYYPFSGLSSNRITVTAKICSHDASGGSTIGTGEETLYISKTQLDQTYTLELELWRLDSNIKFPITINLSNDYIWDFSITPTIPDIGNYRTIVDNITITLRVQYQVVKTHYAKYALNDGYDLDSQGEYSLSTGYRTLASGDYSRASGYMSVASNFCASAEGNITQATGERSHAEGCTTLAAEWAAHAEGCKTEATGKRSHSQNGGTLASGNDSTAMGRGTRAVSDAQLVIGRFNLPSTSHAFVIGNGPDRSGETSDWFEDDENRSNALTVDWNGNLTLSGSVYTPHVYLTNHSAIMGADANGTYRILAYVDSSSRSILANTYIPTRIYGTSIFMSHQPTYGSDRRIKKNIKDLSHKSDELLLNINPIQYEYDESYEHCTEGVNIGFVAQDVEEQMKKLGLNPDDYHIVEKPQDEDDIYTISYTQFIPMLTHLVQSQQKEIDELKKVVSRLKKKLD